MRVMIRVLGRSLLVISLLAGAAVAAPTTSKPSKTHVAKHTRHKAAHKQNKAKKVAKARHKPVHKAKAKPVKTE